MGPTNSNLPNFRCRYLQEPELYAFSHGLSYTTFEYQKLALTASPNAASDLNAFTAQVEVHNTGTQVVLSQCCMSLQVLIHKWQHRNSPSISHATMTSGETRFFLHVPSSS